MHRNLILAIFSLLPFHIFSQVGFKPLQIPVRDGKYLAADLYTTDTTRPKAVILIQTPYNKNIYRLTINIPNAHLPMPFDTFKYNYVIVDWRGFYGSIPATDPAYERGKDGYDVVEWVAKQPWSNGKIGTYGASALGMIQFQTARYRPPHLVCAMPMEKDFKTKYSDFYYGGDYRKEHVESIDSLGLTRKELVLSHPTKDIYWQVAENMTVFADSFNVPMLLVSGWFDHFPSDVLRAFSDIRNSSDPDVRPEHKLVFGPWTHTSHGKADQGELNFSASVGLLDNMASWFFGCYLLDEKNGYPLLPVMNYYVMGKEAWETATDWNSVGIFNDTLFLNVNRELTPGKSIQLNFSDSFTCDPKDPSPSYGGSRFNPFDPGIKTGPVDIHSVVENRSDNLVYSTAILTQPMKIRGNIQTRLYVRSDRTDTDFGIRLCDVYPDGRSILLTQGIKRARFRDSYSSPTLMTAGQVYLVTVELTDLAIDILPGHKLRIVITSSNYPMFDLNLNNGGTIYTAGDTLVAVNHIFADVSHPSCLVFKSSEQLTSIGENNSNDMNQVKLAIYPNPFSTQTTINYELPVAGLVTVKILDLFGNEITSLVDKFKSPGEYSEMISTASFKAGIYFCILEMNGTRIVKKMMVIN